MKKTLVLILAFTGLALHSQAASVSLSAPSTVTGPFDVTVLATGVFDPPHDGDGLFGYGFNFSYDNSILSYLGETPGSLFDDISSNPGLTAQVAGVADAGFLALGDFTEPLTLATLHFNIVGFGPTTISVNADATNLDQGLAYLSASDSFSASAAVNAVPEPGTFALLGLAGAGLLAFRRRRA